MATCFGVSFIVSSYKTGFFQTDLHNHYYGCSICFVAIKVKGNDPSIQYFANISLYNISYESLQIEIFPCNLMAD